MAQSYKAVFLNFENMTFRSPRGLLGDLEVIFSKFEKSALYLCAKVRQTSYFFKRYRMVFGAYGESQNFGATWRHPLDTK